MKIIQFCASKSPYTQIKTATKIKIQLANFISFHGPSLLIGFKFVLTHVCIKPKGGDKIEYHFSIESQMASEITADQRLEEIQQYVFRPHGTIL